MSEQHPLQELSDFIDGNPDPRELKRAMSVMMWIEGVPGLKIQKILNVSATFIAFIRKMRYHVTDTHS